MPKRLPQIHEHQEERLQLFTTITDRERRNRVHALFLAKMGYCHTRKAIARALHVERKAVERWFTQYEHEGCRPSSSVIGISVARHRGFEETR